MTHKIFLCISLTLVCVQLGICQSTTDPLSEWFDTTVGKENLSISNGFISNNQYVTNNNTNICLINSQFSVGSVMYENQFYGNLFLNYDSYQDQLLLKPNGNDDLKSLVIKTEYTSSFTFLGRTFVNLNYLKKNTASFLNGYFEEKVVAPNLILYIKHIKTRSEKIDKNQILSEFSSSNQFVILKDGKFYRFSQSLAEQLYPQLKNEIKTFYSDNLKIQKSDEKTFIEMLLKQLNSLSK